MCLEKRLYSSIYVAITVDLAEKNSRYETGSSLPRSVPCMRAEVCLHIGLCFRAKGLLFSFYSEDPRVVWSFSKPGSSWSGMSRFRSCSSAIVTSCPVPPLMRPPDILVELPLGQGKNQMQDIIIGRFVVPSLGRQWRRKGSRQCSLPCPAVVHKPFHAHDQFRKHRALGKTEGLGVYDCCSLEAGWIISPCIVWPELTMKFW